MIHRPLKACLVALAMAALGAGAVAGPVEGSSLVRGTPLQLLGRLATKAEHGRGYARSLFSTWTDADGDGCNTRYEVLIAESLTPVRVGAGCYLTRGSWRSVYDGYVGTDPSRLQIDHVVALKEAWDSGAWAWTAWRRQAFANDLGDSRTLRAVSGSSNEAKGDQDPAQWLPPSSGFRCTYATWWVDIKVRWSLAVDPAERAALRSILGRCPATLQTVRVA